MAGMTSIALSLPTTDAQVEPLAQALVALRPSSDGRLACDAVSVALGIPFMVVAARTASSARLAMTFGQDVALVDAADQCGLQVRPMHTRRTAATLEASKEYDLHFRDSYAPLIRRALAHDQPVLAWGGWSTPADSEWGVITAYDESNEQFGGVCGTLPGESPLVGSPRQCYVVEAVKAEPTSNPGLYALGARAVLRLGAEADATTAFASGADAFRVWRDRAQCGERIADELRSAIERTRHNRQSCLNWLCGAMPSAEPSAVVLEAAIRDRLVAELERSIAALRKVLLATRSPHLDRLAETLTHAANGESQLRAALLDVAGPNR
jgi:hypothetical protein